MAHYKILVPPPRRHRTGRIVLVVTAIVIVVGAGAFLVGRHIQDDSHRARTTGGATGGATGGTVAAKALTVVSTTPTTGATGVPSNQVVSVHLSLPVTGPSGMPAFTPPVSGTWAKTGAQTLSFHASAPFIPTSTETLVIPAGSQGPTSTDGKVLGAPVSVTFTVAQASTERLQQLLAELNY